jgi:hypothetical protein
MSSQYDITQQFLNGGVVPADLVGQETVSKTYVDGKVGSQNAEIAIIAGLAATAQNTANTGVSAAGAAQSTANTAVGAAGLAQHTAEIAQATVDTHKVSSKAHDSLSITYSGPVEGASSVKQAIDLTKQRVDNIVASGGTSNIEIVDARQPATGNSFVVLGARLNDADGKINNLTVAKANNSDLEAANAAISSLSSIKMDKSTLDISVTQINKNLGKIDQSYLSDSLLAQIAGTAGVNVEPLDGSVTLPKMGFPVIVGSASKNLFNKDTVLPNSYITATGTIGTSAGWYASDWIPVLPNTTYHKKSFNSAAFYDASKVFISPLTDGGVRTFTTPTNCYWVRLTIASTDTVTINTEQFELGSVETSYEPYGATVTTAKIKDFDPVISAKLAAFVLNESNFPHKPVYTPLVNKNLFNKLDALANSYITATGTVETAAGWYASGWIPVLPNTTYYKNTFNSASYYTANKTYISASTPGRGALTTPANCYYVRITIAATDATTINEAQFELGSTGTIYESGLPLILREQIKGLVSASYGNVIIVAKSGGDYDKIGAAVAAVSGTPTTILLMPGTYKEVLRINGKPISIVGINKKTCIIRDDSGAYANAPVNMGGGNHLFNLTIIATHDELPEGFTGEPSYAVHHDFAGEGESTISNCILKSYQSAAVGIGTQPNQQLTIENCDILTDTTGVTYTSNTRPALLFHPYVYTGLHQKLIVQNCRIHCNYSRVLSIIDSNNNGYPGSTGDNRDTTITFYNNMFWSDSAGKTNVIYKPQGPLEAGRFEGYITLTTDSYGNNLTELNP